MHVCHRFLYRLANRSKATCRRERGHPARQSVLAARFPPSASPQRRDVQSCVFALTRSWRAGMPALPARRDLFLFASRYYARANVPLTPAHVMPTRAHVMPAREHGMLTRGNAIPARGNAMRVRGNGVPVRGIVIRRRGNAMRVRGNNHRRGGQRLLAAAKIPRARRTGRRAGRRSRRRRPRSSRGGRRCWSAGSQGSSGRCCRARARSRSPSS